MLEPQAYDITDARPEDLPLIADWYAREWAEPSAKDRILKSLQDRLSSKKIYSMKVVRDGETLVGVACLQEKDMGDAHPEFTPWLAGVYVEQEYRHKGIGLLLSQAIVTEARKQNFKESYLFTDKMSFWYQKQGWELIGRETYKNMQVSVMKISY